MLEKGDEIGEYTLIKLLGKGQFGEVWLAEKGVRFSSRKFRHALKFLSNNDEEINLRDAEAEMDTWMEASGHPNVMPVLDIFVHKNFVIIASEYADGGSLHSWLKVQGGKTSTYEKALDMAAGILRGIEHLHARSIVHRDLKPDNILLQGDFPRITDFGISRIVSENTTATKAHGSPAYMSPEAFHGNKLPQTDIWSAGVILYEMLTGRYPFEGTSIFGLRDSISQDEPRPLPGGIDFDIQAIVYKALQKKREDRFQSARQMRLAVEKALHKVRVQATAKTVDQEEFISTERIIPSTDIPDEKTEEIPVQDILPPEQTYFIAPVIKNGETRGASIDAIQDPQNPEKRGTEERDDKAARMMGKIPVKRKGSVVGMVILATAAVVAIIGFLIFWNMKFEPVPETSGDSPARPTEGITMQQGIESSSPSEPPVYAGMVYIEGGDFTMGRDNGKTADEMPAHQVSVGPFYMDKYEVTNEQYAEFVKATNRRAPPGWRNNIYPKDKARFPVVGVNWNDANEYAVWVGKRLPTEYEWEFAARGKEGFVYPWGNEWQPGRANNVESGSRTVAEIGKFDGASPFGVYDMSGNAWEWTASDFKAYPKGKVSDIFKDKSNLKTIRGNSFDGSKDYSTTTYRIGWAITGEKDYSRTGFRCAKDIDK